MTISPARVLVADDLEANRFIMSAWLRRGGHTVLEAATGGQALQLLAEHSFDVVLLDVQLPDMSGFEVTEHAKSDPRTASIPVVLVSAAYIEPEDRIAGLNGGADAYLTQPVDPGELLATVEAALRYHRARVLAERLAARLTRLTEATLRINAATSFDELIAASAASAAAVLESAATALVVTPGGEPRAGAAAAPGETPLVRPTPAAVAKELSEAAGVLREGVAVGELADPAWHPAAAVSVAVARSSPGRPPVCLAVDAASVPTAAERDLLVQLAQATAQAVESLRALAEEHTLALTLQRSLLPSSLPEHAGLEMAHRYVPASVNAEVGGDFYEAIELDGELLIAIGDVCGHSIRAATIMGEIRHALRAYAIEGHSPSEILRLLDALLVRFHGWDSLTTMCLLRLDLAAGTMLVANAGHVPPLVAGAGGTCYLDVAGPLLGVGLEHPEAAEFPLPPGMLVVLTTDGLVERSGVDLDEGMELLRASVAHTDDLDELCERLLTRFGRGKQDDIALLALRTQ
ncbi:CheY-like chemotaxis protein [Crossiella equi]|uniref:CheY-like chemotaxis protein n=1 Tax=Crossiella equi TaxID=130796 RepID=A0ABS5ASF6_9PSEU|nr:fused response regulator/phosphatase [Crossiella equi]MBP2479513.1 CheY-like chemotaxis protein [Crossiella equi]